MCDPVGGVEVGGKVGPKVGHAGGWLASLGVGIADDLRASACRELAATPVADVLLYPPCSLPAMVRPTAIITNRLFDFALNRDVDSILQN